MVDAPSVASRKVRDPSCDGRDPPERTVSGVHCVAAGPSLPTSISHALDLYGTHRLLRNAACRFATKKGLDSLYSHLSATHSPLAQLCTRSLPSHPTHLTSSDLRKDEVDAADERRGCACEGSAAPGGCCSSDSRSSVTTSELSSERSRYTPTSECAMW